MFNCYELRGNCRGSLSMSEQSRSLQVANGQPGEYTIMSDFGRPMTVRVEVVETPREEDLPEFDL